MSAGKADDEVSDWRRGICCAALLKAILLAVTLVAAWANSDVHEARFRKLWVQWPPGQETGCALGVHGLRQRALPAHRQGRLLGQSLFSGVLSLVAGLDSRRSVAVWRFFFFQGLRDFKPAFGECAIVFGVGLVLSRSCGLAAMGSVAELRRRIARQRQWLGSEHCGGKPALVGVLSRVHFLSVSLQRVLVFLFVDGAHARASNRPSHSDLGLRMLVAVGARTGSFLFSPFDLAVLRPAKSFLACVRGHSSGMAVLFCRDAHGDRQRFRWF